MTRKALLLLVAGSLLACNGTIGPPSGSESEGNGPGSKHGGGAGSIDPLTLTPEETSAYLAKLAPPLVGRVLTANEITQIEELGGAAIEPLLDGWSKEDAFIRAGRTMIEQRLSVGGVKEDIDFNVPGRLVEHVIRHERPWSEILTSDTCYDTADEPAECDTGAPYAAGVLATRGYLISRRGRFNLTRASTMLKTFACRGYPMEDELQPRLEKELLLPMFRASTAEEQTDPKAKSGFGNGGACYTCHGQFSAHAQLFVKFDENGLWQKDATGIQDPVGELGRSVDGLFASHMFAPEDSKSEATQLFGEEVANLAAAAKVLAASPTFVECASRNVLEYALLVDQSVDVPPAILKAIAERASGGAEPTFGDIVLATLTSPEVVAGVVQHMTGLETGVEE